MKCKSKRGLDGLDFIGDLSQFIEARCCKFSDAEISAMQRNLKDEEWKERVGRCPCPDALSDTCLGEWRNDGLDVVPLQVANDGIGIQALQEIAEIKNKKKIVVILESPHRKEYSEKKCCKRDNCRLYATPAPARGETGKSLKKMLPHMFGDYFKNYHVALVNAVQYQCSLGLGNKKLKSTIFETMFLGGDTTTGNYQGNFIARLSEIYNPVSDILVIACTKRKDWGKKILHMLTEDKGMILLMNHPSSWYRKSSTCNHRRVWFVNMGQIKEDEFYCENKFKELTAKLIAVLEKGAS